MSEPTIDVVGIGNALVDVISHETPDFIAGQGLVPGSMNLIDEDRREALAVRIEKELAWQHGAAHLARWLRVRSPDVRWSEMPIVL